MGLKNPVSTSPQQGLELYRTMLTIRRFDEVAVEESIAGRIRGGCHPYIGEEAIATGICSVLKRTDYIASYHRGHGHCIAKGADTIGMMAELHGRATGTCGGKAGSLHIADVSIGMLGANGIIGDGVTISVGAAQASRMLGSDAVAVAFFGDGGINRGPILEAMNWAAAFGLSVLFVCEDNLYSYTQRTSEVTAGPGIVTRAAAFGMRAQLLDGNDVILVREVAGDMVAQMRRGAGPALIHATTYRHRGHIARDTAAYRPAGELARYRLLDPLKRCEAWLIEHGIARDELTLIQAEVNELIERALREARAAPLPDAKEIFTNSQDIGAPA